MFDKDIDTTFWPREYEKEGVVYVLDISSRRGPWTVYIKKSGAHVTFGPDAETALKNAGLTIFNRVKE